MYACIPEIERGFFEGVCAPSDATANFRDLDLLLLGDAVRQTETVFDDYWNSPAAAGWLAITLLQALREFVEAILHDSGFKGELEAFVKPLIEPGRVNSLAQLLLKLTAPGIPGNAARP